MSLDKGPLDLTPSTEDVLLTIVSEQPITVRHLAELSNINHRTMYYSIYILEAAGLIDSKPDLAAVQSKRSKRPPQQYSVRPEAVLRITEHFEHRARRIASALDKLNELL